MSALEQEELRVMLLDTRNRVVTSVSLSWLAQFLASAGG